MILLPAAVYCFYYFVTLKNNWALCLAGCFVFGYGIYTAEARLVTGVCIASLFGYVASKVWTGRWNKRCLAVVAVCAVVAGIGIYYLCDPLRFGSRTGIYLTALDLISQNMLFGYGAGAWNALVDSGTVHCEPLNVVLDFGIIGLVIVALAALYAIRGALKARRRFDVIVFLMFTATSATYVLRYWVILFCFCLLAGRLISEKNND
jgi:hypothetical protein